jgi:hypothetical protein
MKFIEEKLKSAPQFTWCMPKANSNNNQVQEFFRGPLQTKEITFSNSNEDRIVSTSLSKYPEVATYSVTCSSPRGSGKFTCLTLTKTRNHFDHMNNYYIELERERV